MTVTIPAQADELRIIDKPATTSDGQLLLQILQLSAMNGGDRGWHLLVAFETPPTLSQLRRRHDRTSEDYHQVMAFLQICEALGTYVKHGLISRALVVDLLWVDGAWERAEKICKGLRKEAGEPRIFENFEALAHGPA